MILKLILLLAVFFILDEDMQAQTCDCNIYPISKECKDTCHIIKMFQSGTKKQLTDSLKLTNSTAQELINLPERKKIKSVQDLKGRLTTNAYNELESTFNIWVTTNVSGDFVAGNKNEINYYNIGDTVNKSLNSWFGFGLLAEVGYGKLEHYEFLAIPYGAFLKAYLSKKIAIELQYSRSKFKLHGDLKFISTGVKSGEISATFAYQDITTLLNVTSIRSKKNRFRAYGGAKISFRRWAEFETTRMQSNFVGRGELPTFPQYTSVVFGCGYEFGGHCLELPLIQADLRFDFGTNNIMREFFIPETNTTIDYGKVSYIGLQIGIGF